jgi:hypothetical protein
LDFLVDLTLLVEQRGDLAGMIAQGVTDVAQIIGDFHERPGDLLQLGKAIQLQGIEFQLVRLGALILPRLDASLGLGRQVSHLSAQAGDRLFQLVEVEAHRADALIDTGAEDAALAHLVDQGIEQRGADPDTVGGRGGGRFFSAIRAVAGCWNHHRRRRRDRLRAFTRFGAELRHATHRSMRVAAAAGAAHDPGQHLVQAVQGALNGIQDGRRRLD